MAIEKTVYELPNGVRVECGPLEIACTEEADRTVFRVYMNVRTFIPGWVAKAVPETPKTP